MHAVFMLCEYFCIFVLNDAEMVVFAEKARVMLLCGTDLLESLITPGVWIPDQVSCSFKCLHAFSQAVHIIHL